jgi:hypothetical protein
MTTTISRSRPAETILGEDNERMSESRGVVSPDDIGQWRAGSSSRMFMGPLEAEARADLRSRA